MQNGHVVCAKNWLELTISSGALPLAGRRWTPRNRALLQPCSGSLAVPVLVSLLRKQTEKMGGQRVADVRCRQGLCMLAHYHRGLVFPHSCVRFRLC